MISPVPGIADVVSENIARGVEAGDEGLGAEHVGDEAGRDLRHVAGAGGDERQRAESGGGWRG